MTNVMYSTVFNCALDDAHVITVGQLNDLKIVDLLHIADPFVRLTLWVDEQAPSLRVVHYYGVLDREGVTRQAEHVPRVNLYLGAQNCDKIVLLRARNRGLRHVFRPFLKTLGAEFGSIRSQVGDDAAGY